MTPPISKKLPPVEAVPIRKKRGSVCAHAPEGKAKKSKLAQARPRQQWFSTQRLVSSGETSMGNDTMLAKRLQPTIPLSTTRRR
jgi:hypothetical protein